VRRPSPAMVVAFIALFSSLVGGAVAARLITSKQVKNGSLLAKDFKKGQLAGPAKMARGGANNFTNISSGGPTEVVSLQVKAPAKGSMVLTYSATINNGTPGTWINVLLRDRGRRINEVEWWDPGDDDDNFDDTQSNHLVVPVKKGRHTYSLALEMSAGSATVHDARLTAQYARGRL
jgi:hypothetical protein